MQQSEFEDDNPYNSLVKLSTDHDIDIDIDDNIDNINGANIVLHQETNTFDDYFKLVIENTKRILNIYKSISHMSPNWISLFADTECSNNSTVIFNDIMHFVMTRTIDEKYQNILNHRNCINNPFQRALWHMGSATDFSQNTHEVHMYIMMIDAYCLLSREKTLIEFEDFCEHVNKKYRNKNIINKGNDHEIPYWVYNLYHNKPYPNTLLNLPLMNNKMDPLIFYKYLCKVFEKPTISISSALYDEKYDTICPILKNNAKLLDDNVSVVDDYHSIITHQGKSFSCSNSRGSTKQQSRYIVQEKYPLKDVGQQTNNYNTRVAKRDFGRYYKFTKNKALKSQTIEQKVLRHQPMIKSVNNKHYNKSKITNRCSNSDRANWRSF
jgi:hypothetical protein